uniref:Uncharacterized protein n=1 Tax=Lepeophtheirus salmonis TaxID=72036 RepID=A0A0K2V5U3_LEPSM
MNIQVSVRLRYLRSRGESPKFPTFLPLVMGQVIRPCFNKAKKPFSIIFYFNILSPTSLRTRLNSVIITRLFLF